MSGFRERLSGEPFHVLDFSWGERNTAVLDFPVYFDTNLRVNRPSDAFVCMGLGFDVQASISDRLFFGLNTFYGASLATWQTPPFGKFLFPLREDYVVYQLFL